MHNMCNTQYEKENHIETSPWVAASSMAVSNTCPQAHGSNNVMEDVRASVPALAMMRCLSGLDRSNNRCSISEFIPRELSGKLLSSHSVTV